MGYELLELGINKLGYGNMRLPFVNGEIDYDTIFKMVDAFIASGGSYFDTAFAYLHSEEVLRKALVERYPRDKYFITTKAALFSVKTPEELQEQIGISLERLGLDYVDNYFLHALSGPLIEKADRLGAWDYLKSLKEKGLTRHIGFS
ncbi:MAG: aldo/keto reductase, partial [Oscillospiraceae bacterium]|nr:aldo/keto reductase [Oscillospiraceae bacterium]